MRMHMHNNDSFIVSYIVHSQTCLFLNLYGTHAYAYAYGTVKLYIYVGPKSEP